ncbi:hypothetical protein [Nocardia cyriacigeorgica]|uniref:hypothetical protein n=1 Tax=Nocardia cyriacigeorgica TaxID=135487 RepID=UPI0013D14972|nr:hypothetical protein [Nocardia cyriacigeorgica]MBF6438759.1 hypothetical protein [Nocardia cyriacigeorgica]NEW30168.1 hypothetical protein [Nocardia cyriacigeorgica]
MSAAVIGAATLVIAACEGDEGIPPTPPVSSTTTATTTAIEPARPDLAGLPTCDAIADRLGRPELTGGTQTDHDPGGYNNRGVYRVCAWKSGTVDVEAGVLRYPTEPLVDAGFTNMMMLCPGEPAPAIGNAQRAAFCQSTRKPECGVFLDQGTAYIDLSWGRDPAADPAVCQADVIALATAASELVG